MWFHDVVQDRANSNARAGTPQNQITFEMLTGMRQFDSVEAQIQCPPLLHEQFKEGAKSQTWLSNFTFTFHLHALEKEMATHSSVLVWRIPGTGEPGGLPSMGLHRVGHDWSDLAAAAAALEAWDWITPQREPKSNYTKILQGPNEAYVEFLTRLGVAISHNVVREETRVQLEKLLAYENENQECQRAIASIRETGNVIDYLKACRNLGSETQKMQMLAEAMAAAFKKGNEGDKSHLKKDCPKKHTENIKTTKKPPGVFPQCHKGVH